MNVLESGEVNRNGVKERWGMNHQPDSNQEQREYTVSDIKLLLFLTDKRNTKLLCLWQTKAVGGHAQSDLYQIPT